MIILGINAYHGDAAACLLRDGKLVAAVEEERFRRVKHWAGLPVESVRYCLRQAGLKMADINHIAVNRDPKANVLRKVIHAFSKRPDRQFVEERLKNAMKVAGVVPALQKALGETARLKATVHAVEHHRAHLASAFFVSPFPRALVVSVDGFGDFASALWAQAEENRLDVKGGVYFPHSLGLFYLAMTQFLGFPNYGDEYKVMGLAAYGRPKYTDLMRKILRLKADGQFELNLEYFIHHTKGALMLWDNQEPSVENVYSEKLMELLGPSRVAHEAVLERHKDLAASLQDLYEEAFFHMLNAIYQLAPQESLCLAGGCAMNSVANGKIFERTRFKRVYVQPAAGDAGGALGAAFYVWHQVLKQKRSFVMTHAFWGPGFANEEILSILDKYRPFLKEENCRVEAIEEELLCQKAAQAIAEGKVVGWFQGRMEWGPRALGNRSIVCDPRRSDIRQILNEKIKHRELFRPFAPSVLRESVGEWFEEDQESPFMSFVFSIKEEKKALVPAITHVDGTGRLQSVTRDENPLYYKLIASFKQITGVPMVLNTSFNESEPIVCAPEEALQCFLRTKMDQLFLGNLMITRL